MSITEEKLKLVISTLGLEYKPSMRELNYMTGEIKVSNNFANGNLYVFCKYEMKNEAQALGLKYDFNVKLAYIPKTLNRKKVEKILALNISLYGKNTSVGYLDYKYEIIVPKYICISSFGLEKKYKIDFDMNDTYENDEVLKMLSENGKSANKSDYF